MGTPKRPAGIAPRTAIGYSGARAAPPALPVRGISWRVPPLPPPPTPPPHTHPLLGLHIDTTLGDNAAPFCYVYEWRNATQHPPSAVLLRADSGMGLTAVVMARWRPHTFTHYSDEPRDRDRLGGTLPTWLSEAAAAGRELEALRDVRRMAQTLVMGHGTSVLAREYGGAVGRFRHVVRFNRFEVEGYERWVGNKTTSW